MTECMKMCVDGYMYDCMCRDMNIRDILGNVGYAIDQYGLHCSQFAQCPYISTFYTNLYIYTF